jgi:hypothetical protein
MMRILVGAVGVIVVQAILVWGYLAVNQQDPIILNPDRRLDENGAAMIMFCGDGSDKEMLDQVPPDKELGPWTRGRTIRGDCDIWYHHSVLYRPGAD